MSARTRELFALIPVALLVTAGFTAILITESEQLDNLSVFYGAYFLGLCLATHFVIRAACPTPTRSCSRSSPCSPRSGW